MRFPSREIVEKVRLDYPAGTRVELVRMDDIQAPPIGTRGTVKGVDDTASIMVAWDNGSGLNVVYGEDVCRKLKTVKTQFLETRKFQINEIARIFRVPPHMVGDLEKSSFSNIEQQSLEFVKYTLDPWVSRWEQSMARALLTPEEKKQYFMKFNVDGLLRGDYQSRMSGYAVGRQNGWMSANDIRELENLDRIPEELGGDLYLINGNMMPLSMSGAAYQKGKEEPNEDEEVLELEESEEPGNGGGGARPGTERHHRGR